MRSFWLSLLALMLSACGQPQPATVHPSQGLASEEELPELQGSQLDGAPDERGPRFVLVPFKDEGLLLWLKEGRLMAQLAGSDSSTPLTALRWLDFDAATLPNDDLIILGILEDGALVRLKVSPQSTPTMELVALTRIEDPQDRWVEVVTTHARSPHQVFYALIGSNLQQHPFLLPVSEKGEVAVISPLKEPLLQRGHWTSHPCEEVGTLGATISPFGEKRVATLFGPPGEEPLYHLDFYLGRSYDTDTTLSSPMQSMGFQCTEEKLGGWVYWVLGEGFLNVYSEYFHRDLSLPTEAQTASLLSTKEGLSLVLLNKEGLSRVALTIGEEERISAEPELLFPEATGSALRCILLNDEPLCATSSPDKTRPMLFMEQETTASYEDLFGKDHANHTLESEASLCGSAIWEELYNATQECCDGEGSCVDLTAEICEWSLRSFLDCDLDPGVLALDERARSYTLELVLGTKLYFSRDEAGWRLEAATDHDPARIECGSEAFEPFARAVKDHCKDTKEDLHCFLTLESMKRCQRTGSLRMSIANMSSKRRKTSRFTGIYGSNGRTNPLKGRSKSACGGSETPNCTLAISTM